MGHKSKYIYIFQRKHRSASKTKTSDCNSACLGYSTAGGLISTPNAGGGDDVGDGGGLNPPVLGSTVPAIDMAVASHLCRPLLLAVCLCFVSLLF